MVAFALEISSRIFLRSSCFKGHVNAFLTALQPCSGCNFIFNSVNLFRHVSNGPSDPVRVSTYPSCMIRDVDSDTREPDQQWNHRRSLRHLSGSTTERHWFRMERGTHRPQQG